MKKRFLAAYILFPVIYIISSVIVGLLCRHSGMDILSDTLGIPAIYYLLISVVAYVKWDKRDKKVEKQRD